MFGHENKLLLGLGVCELHSVCDAPALPVLHEGAHSASPSSTVTILGCDPIGHPFRPIEHIERTLSRLANRQICHL